MALRPLSASETPTRSARAYDVRGWPVHTGADRERAGRVEDLLVDEGGTPRYLDVRLSGDGRRVLVPIGDARLDSREDMVWLPGLRRPHLTALPEWAPDASAVTPDYERRVAEAYASSYRGANYYERPAYRAPVPRMSGAGEFVTGRLAALSDLEDYRIAEDDPDPRDWDVIAADGIRVGRVEELVVDTDANKVRYLVCKLSATRYRTIDGSLHRLIPIGYARLDEDDERVLIDALGAGGMERLPAFTGMPIDRAYEDRLHEAFLEAYRAGARYRHPRYSPERFAATRRGRAA